MIAELVDGNVQLEAPGESQEVRRVPGAQWNPELQRWIFPLSWAICVQLRTMLGSGLEVGPELAAWARGEQVRRIDPALEVRSEKDGPAPERASEFFESPEGEEEAPAVDVENQWWWDLWQGMPEYLNRKLSPWKTLKIHFRSQRDLDAFADLVGQRIAFKQRSTWYPYAEPITESDWRYATEGEEAPDSGPISIRERKRLADQNGEVPRKELRSKKPAKKKRSSIDALLNVRTVGQ